MANEDKFSRYTIRSSRRPWNEGDDESGQNHFHAIGDIALSVVIQAVVQISNPQFSPPYNTDSVESIVEKNVDEL